MTVEFAPIYLPVFIKDGKGEYTFNPQWLNWFLLSLKQVNSASVSSVSVNTANGLAGLVATATTTPVITLRTTVTGILKGDGTSITAAVAGDFPTLNQNTTGSAEKWTTARTLAGNSVDGSANVAFANKVIVQGTVDAGLSAAQFLGALGTGIVKNTTTTGVLSIAVAGDFPTLNQNTTGTAANVTTNANLTGPITSSGNATAIASQTGTGTKFVVDNSPTLITPNIGTATGTSLAVTGAITSSGGGVGYVTGAGGTVAQATSKATGVSLSKLCGTITLNAAALAAQTTVSFVLTNTFIAATDVVHVVHDSVGTLGAYNFAVTPAAGTCSIAVRNLNTASLSEAIVLRFVVIKAVTA